MNDPDLHQRLKNIADPPSDGFHERLDERLAAEPLPAWARRVTMLHRTQSFVAAAVVLVIVGVFAVRYDGGTNPGSLCCRPPRQHRRSRRSHRPWQLQW